jgi:hypothetical protein
MVRVCEVAAVQGCLAWRRRRGIEAWKCESGARFSLDVRSPEMKLLVASELKKKFDCTGLALIRNRQRLWFPVRTARFQSLVQTVIRSDSHGAGYIIWQRKGQKS